MPTYEYQCRTCNHRFETWQRMTDEPLTTCPECGGQIRRVLFPAGIVFKGSGFYKTDHGSGSVPSENGSNDHKPKAEEAESKKGAETSAESKSEGSTEKTGAKSTEDKVAAAK